MNAFRLLVLLVIVVGSIAAPAAAVYYLGGLDAWCWLIGVVLAWGAVGRAMLADLGRD